METYSNHSVTRSQRLDVARAVATSASLAFDFVVSFGLASFANLLSMKRMSLSGQCSKVTKKIDVKV